jgi:hypothetical protein
MTREFFDSPWEETDIVVVDQRTDAKARKLLAGCEACTQVAEIPFDWVLDCVTGKSPAVTDYTIEKPFRCCSAAVLSPKDTRTTI